MINSKLYSFVSTIIKFLNVAMGVNFEFITITYLLCFKFLNVAIAVNFELIYNK